MIEPNKVDLLIIGGGPAGISAAIWAKRLGVNHLLLEARSEIGGQLTDIHNKIIDYPGMIVQNGVELQEHLKQHAQKIAFNVETGCKVNWVDWDKKRVFTNSNAIYEFRSILVSTGSSPRKLRVPGEQEMIDRNEVYSATRDKDKFKGKNVAVIGGGDRAFEGALLLAEAGSNVTLIHRSEQFKARKEFTDPVIQHANINVITNTVVTNIQGENRKQLTLATLESTSTVTADGVFIRIGVEPNTYAFKDGISLDDEGYITCTSVGETSLPYVYAAGDVCTRPLLSSIASSVGQGMTAVKCLSFYLND
ncbi:NAD(P)/FAD-dependent oxidoreductase [Guptibacillus hwajinpoensis]|uniref:Thioredoxin reductase (NADPH) n=1 Tax=Guptibacillus hwajinpoensis TaxID=208199 RepID=A0ABU0K0S8_9BACL|nr:NAD(P)/FAD-dependent oxidoreductase [Alkalihalobacillus hemicentroti]MDQ0482033.1 thioredoxin reductase (NADPH) [Alkalihalobacillus hemicentroti]